MAFARPQCRIDGRRLFHQRGFSHTSSDRIPGCLLEFRQSRKLPRCRSAFGGKPLLPLSAILAFIPTLITRYIIFGGILRFSSYTALPWDWTAPNWRSVLFSSEHGLLSWTPILGFAIAGLFLAPRAARSLALVLAISAMGFYYVISSYPYWHGMA